MSMRQRTASMPTAMSRQLVGGVVVDVLGVAGTVEVDEGAVEDDDVVGTTVELDGGDEVLVVDVDVVLAGPEVVVASVDVVVVVGGAVDDDVVVGTGEVVLVVVGTIT